MPLKIVTFSLLLFLSCFYISFAQKDTIKTSHYHKNTYKPSTDFDQRFSFIRNKSVNIWGQRIGVLINEKFKVGVGGYFLNDKVLSKKLLADGVPYYSTNRKLIFGTAYIEPFLFRKNYWELSIPFEVGYGKSSYNRYETETANFVNNTSKSFVPLGVGLSLSLKLPSLPFFKPLHWIGINFLAGYRYCLLENVFKTNYDGFFWSISGAIFLDRVSDDYKHWKKVRSEKKAVSSEK